MRAKWLIEQILTVFAGAWTQISRIFGSPSSRVFLIPSQYQFEKVYFVLTSMQYQVSEQRATQSEFRLKATLTPPYHTASHPIPSFRNIRISIQGSREVNQEWRICLTLRAERVLFSSNLRSSELLLEDVIQALAWRTFSSYTPPSIAA